MKTLTRRHVLMTLSGSAVMLCPAILNAQTVDLDWGGLPTTEPVGAERTLQLEAGMAEVEISALAPGDVAVLARPTDDVNYSNTGQVQYIGVLHRTEEQIAAADDPDGLVQNPRYLVVNLVCTHRGKAVGMTGNPEAPFACLDRGSRHSSVYNASGLGVSGASEGERLSAPDYEIAVNDDAVVLMIS